MLIDFPNFERYLLEHDRESILAKGKHFVSENLIKHIHAFSGTEWDVYVESERPDVPGYTVRVRVSNGKVVHMNCNCLGFRFKPICKHVVGALYTIREKNLYDESIGDYEAEEEEMETETEKEKERAKEGKEEKMEGEGDKDVVTKKKVVKKGGAARKDPFEKEFECRTCRNLLKDPIPLPCQSHSVCFTCAEALLEKAKEDENGVKTLMCPDCGKKGGVMKIKDIKELKPNKELERVKHAYEKEKEKWLKEKEKLEKELESLKTESKGEEKEKTKGKGERMPEEVNLKQSLYEADVDKLKEVANFAFYRLKNEGKSMDDLLRQLDIEQKDKPIVEEMAEKGKEEVLQDKVNLESKSSKKGKKSPVGKKSTTSKSTSRRKGSTGQEKENVLHPPPEETERYNLRTKKVKP